jgi:hypothetical protein
MTTMTPKLAQAARMRTTNVARRPDHLRAAAGVARHTKANTTAEIDRPVRAGERTWTST